MIVEQIYTGCLSHAAYYIESAGEAAIIDPLRDVDQYVRRAQSSGATIKYVFETHFHADFVSGHLDLARRTEAKIVYGPGAEAAYDLISAQDGQEFQVGDVRIRVLHTPGHTMESSCFLLINEEGQEKALFTGDTLFLGDVGRPDLAVKTDLTREQLAEHLYASLTQKILPLQDDLILYPGHGAGSACGKNLSKETVGTLGEQRRTNYALQPMTQEEFVREVTAGLTAPPQYFPLNAGLNKAGYESIDTVRAQGAIALDPAAFEVLADDRMALVLDTRSGPDFSAGHIPGSVNISLEGQFANWVGSLVTDIRQAILIVAPAGAEAEVVDRLARIGYDNVLGHLAGGIEAWAQSGRETRTLSWVTAQDFATQNPDLSVVLDVRGDKEYLSEHLVGTINKPLPELNTWMSTLDRNQTYYIHCAGGYRSRIAASILLARGFEVVDIRGGFAALKETALPKTDYVCPSKLA